MKKSFFIIPLCLLPLAYACHSEQAQSHLHSVMVVKPQPIGTEISKNFSGRVEEAREINLGFKTAGQIEEIFVKEGDYVEKGKLIARLDDKDYRLAVEALDVQYRQLTNEINRMKQLMEAKSVSENDYEKAVAGWKQLGVQLQTNQNQLEYTRLEAPTNGYVQSVNFEPAEMVNAGTSVITLLDTHHMEVVVDIPTEVYLQRNKITSIRCKSSATGTDVGMRLLSITPKADGNQLYRMRLTFAGNSTPQGLTAGMNIETSLTISTAEASQAAAGSFTLPLSTVFNDNGNDYVWVISPDTVAHKTAVTLNSIDDNGNAIIVNGINGNEMVVKAGVNYIQDNEKVAILAAPAETNVGDIL